MINSRTVLNCARASGLALPWLLALSAPPAAEETFPPLGSASPPATLDALWAPFDPRRESLEAEVLDEWEEGDAAYTIVRFHVGIFKGAPAKVAAFFGAPKNAARLPAIMHIHGGGQSAQLDVVRTDVAHGYASLSLNWGGNKLNFGRSQRTYDGPQTDWGMLDATHPPQRNKANHFAGPLSPDEFTLDAVESPRNSNWFLVLVAARRALTWLEERPEVDPGRLGVFGISMGGKLTTDLVSRFWRTPPVAAESDAWSAACPVMSVDEPLFVFASVTYETPVSVEVKVPAEFTISSRLISVGPAALREANVRATDAFDRMIDSGADGWRDWYLQNWDHPPLWRAFTRKLKDPKWRGPDGAKLSFEIRSDTDNELVVVFETNGWGAFAAGKPAVDYAVVKPVAGRPDWQKVVVGLDELAATKPEITRALADWRTVTQLSIGPRGEVVRDGQEQSVAGKPWRGSREIRNLRWD